MKKIKKKHVKAAQKVSRKIKKQKRKARKVRVEALKNIKLWNAARSNPKTGLPYDPYYNEEADIDIKSQFHYGDLYPEDFLNNADSDTISKLASKAFLFDDETAKKQQLEDLISNHDMGKGMAWWCFHLEEVGREDAGTHAFSDLVNDTIEEIESMTYEQIFALLDDVEFIGVFGDKANYWQTISEGIAGLHLLSRLIASAKAGKAVNID